MGRGKWTGNKDKARYAHNKENGRVCSPPWRKGRSLVTMWQQSNSLSDSQLFWEGETWQYLPIILHPLAVCQNTLSLSLSLSLSLCRAHFVPLSPSLSAFKTGSICPCCVGTKLCLEIDTLFLGVIFVFIDIEVSGRNRGREQKTGTEVNEGYRLKEMVRTLGWSMKSNTQRSERKRKIKGKKRGCLGAFPRPPQTHSTMIF